MKKMLLTVLALGLIMVFGPRAGAAEEEETVKLVQPDFGKGATVLQALKDRKSDRVFGSADLSRQQLSEVLWAAAGVNREMSDGRAGRTAPSSHNDQAIDTYAFLKSGVYKYDPLKHELIQVAEGDLRVKAGVQSYVGTAPLSLIFVADTGRLTGDDEASKREAMNFDAGHMSENVYLYAASAGLNAICRSTIDRDEVRNLLNLDDRYVPLLGVTVGLPPK